MIRVVYDGDCPLRVGYTNYTRLRERNSVVELLNAREHPSLMENYAQKGHEIDDSFIVVAAGEVLTHGSAWPLSMPIWPRNGRACPIS